MISLDAYSDLLATLHAAPLLDHTATASVLLDEDGHIVLMNAAAQTLAAERDGLQVHGDQLGPSDPETQVNFPDAMLRSLYNFTPAETEIANGLLTGYSLEEVALLRRTSPATTRSQMKSLFEKTSTRRQGELIQLLSSLPRTPPDKAHDSR